MINRVFMTGIELTISKVVHCTLENDYAHCIR